MVDKFKAGDKVVRISNGCSFARIGSVNSVTACRGFELHLEGCGSAFYAPYFELYIEAPAPLKGFFRIKDEEHSKLVQEHLFSLGYVWQSGRASVRNTDQPIIYVSSCIFYNSDVFKGYKEYALESSTTYSIKEISPDPVETINIGGMEYSKEGVENALKGLQPIDTKGVS